MISIAILFSLLGCLVWYAQSNYSPEIEILGNNLQFSKQSSNSLGWLLILSSTALLCIKFDIATGIIFSSFAIACSLSFWMMMKAFPKIALYICLTIYVFSFLIEISL